MLALVQAAIVSGAVSSAAIRHWIARAPQEVLAQLGAQRDRRTGLFQSPHPDTVCRTIAQVNAAYVDAAYAMHRTGQLRELYDDPDELIPMTVDGKTQRGTAIPGTPARHRLGVQLADDALMVATIDVSSKSNEITAFAPLLDQIGCLKNVVISADRLHTQREHARYLHRREAFYVFPVGGNQGPVRPARRSGLEGRADRMDHLRPRPRPHRDPHHPGHARPATTRFLHIKQVFLLERHVYDLRWKPLSNVAVLGVTNLPATLAGPRRLADLVRSEWSIENKDHYVRDVTLGEDRCRVRTASAPSILATMRSYAIGALRLLGFTNIADGTRWARDDFHNPLIALSLTM